MSPLEAELVKELIDALLLERRVHRNVDRALDALEELRGRVVMMPRRDLSASPAPVPAGGANARNRSTDRRLLRFARPSFSA